MAGGLDGRGFFNRQPTLSPMRLLGWLGSVLTVALVVLSLVPEASLATHPPASGRYVKGGSLGGGVSYDCLPDWVGHDIGAVCDLPCPTSKCRVTVVDDHYGNDVHFRVCVSGETFCRPQRYWHTADVFVTPGSLITVAPQFQEATIGTATVTALH